ncbi:MAG: outer membrane lipoprotein carrier protein LolA [Sulfuricaulis sp.]|nr:outer membrane lipoprotein carrier protein LolA [Sulfuricaulis sp.]
MPHAPSSRFLPWFARRVWCLLLVNLFLAAAPQHAASDTAEWDFSRLMLDFSQAGSARARFTERKYLHILKEPLSTSGLLEFHAPDRLEKRVLKPYEEFYLVSHDTLVIEQPTKGSARRFVLQRYPVMWAFVEGLRGTLAGNAETLRRFYAINLEGSREHWQLNLDPLDEAMREIITSIRIEGTEARIGTIEILEKNGDRSVMSIMPESP